MILIRIYASLCLLVLLIGVCGTSVLHALGQQTETAANSGWVKQTLPVGVDIYDIYFLNTSHGWLIGGSNKTLHTTDGGQTWNQMPYPVGHKIYFLNSTHGWILRDINIFETTDGGNTWHNASGIASGFYVPPGHGHIQFSNHTLGWIIAEDIWRTTNGGENWTRSLKYRDHHLVTGFFRGEEGWAAGSFGEYVYTADAGQTWQYHNDPEEHFSHLVFPESGHGFAIRESRKFMQTTDNGLHWEPVAIPQPRDLYNQPVVLTYIAFADASNGWLCGVGGTIIHTSDGGAHWYRQSVDTRSALQVIYMLNQTHGWLGGRGVLFYTTDGGGRDLINLLDWVIPVSLLSLLGLGMIAGGVFLVFRRKKHSASKSDPQQ